MKIIYRRAAAMLPFLALGSMMASGQSSVRSRMANSKEVIENIRRETQSHKLKPVVSARQVVSKGFIKDRRRKHFLIRKEWLKKQSYS